MKSTRLETDIRPLLTVVWYGLVPKYLFQNMETALLDNVALRNLFRNTSVIYFADPSNFTNSPSACDGIFLLFFEPDTKL